MNYYMPHTSPISWIFIIISSWALLTTTNIIIHFQDNKKLLSSAIVTNNLKSLHYSNWKWYQDINKINCKFMPG